MAGSLQFPHPGLPRRDEDPGMTEVPIDLDNGAQMRMSGSKSPCPTRRIGYNSVPRVGGDSLCFDTDEEWLDNPYLAEAEAHIRQGRARPPQLPQCVRPEELRSTPDPTADFSARHFQQHSGQPGSAADIEEPTSLAQQTRPTRGFSFLRRTGVSSDMGRTLQNPVGGCGSGCWQDSNPRMSSSVNEPPAARASCDGGMPESDSRLRDDVYGRWNSASMTPDLGDESHGSWMSASFTNEAFNSACAGGCQSANGIRHSDDLRGSQSFASYASEPHSRITFGKGGSKGGSPYDDELQRMSFASYSTAPCTTVPPGVCERDSKSWRGDEVRGQHSFGSSAIDQSGMFGHGGCDPQNRSWYGDGAHMPGSSASFFNESATGVKGGVFAPEGSPASFATESFTGLSCGGACTSDGRAARFIDEPATGVRWSGCASGRTTASFINDRDASERGSWQGDDWQGSQDFANITKERFSTAGVRGRPSEKTNAQGAGGRGLRDSRTFTNKVSAKARACAREFTSLSGAHAAKPETFISKRRILNFLFAEDFSSASALFEEKHDRHFCNAIINECVRASRTDIAVWCMEEMTRLGTAPNVVTCNTILNGYATSGNYRQAVSLWKRLAAMNVVPNKVSYNTMLNACAQAHRPTDAEAMLQEMQNVGIAPCVVSLTAVIVAFANVGDASRAEWWLNRIHDMGLQCDVVAYNSFLNACAKANDLQRAQRWVRKMSEEGIAPCTRTYNTLIHACAKLGDSYLAEQFYHEMQAAGLQPDIFTYGSLIDAHAQKGNTASAMMWLTQATEDGLPLSTVCFNSVIHACSLTGDASCAQNCFAALKQHGCRPTSTTFNCMLATLSLGRKQEAMATVLAEMIGMDIHPDRVTIRAARRVMRHARDNDKSAKIRHLYDAIVRAYVHANSLRLAFEWLRDMNVVAGRPSHGLIAEVMNTLHSTMDTESGEVLSELQALFG